MTFCKFKITHEKCDFFIKYVCLYVCFFCMDKQEKENNIGLFYNANPFSKH